MTDVVRESTQVVVIGAGPTGLLTANLLGLYGINCIVVDENSELSKQPKGILIDDEFYRACQLIGVSNDLDAHLVPQIGVHFLSPLGFPLVKVEGRITDLGLPNRQATSQPLLEDALARNLQRWATVQRRMATRFLTCIEEADSMTVSVQSAGSSAYEIACQYLVGADGSHSAVREAAGIIFEGQTIKQPHVVVDVADDTDNASFSRFYCHPSRPRNSVPAPFGGRRFEFMLLPRDDASTILEDANLARLFGSYRQFDRLKIIRKAVYTFHARLVERMSRGRIFLAGDAAHVMPPFGAQGLNSGGKDAVNLSWKMAFVLQGRAHAKLLETYHIERHGHVRKIIDLSVRIGRLANLRSWFFVLLRDLFFVIGNLIPAFRHYFATMRYMPRQRYEEGFVWRDKTAGWAGRCLPGPIIRLADGTTKSLAAHLSSGFGILAIGPCSDHGHEVEEKFAPLAPCCLFIRRERDLPSKHAFEQVTVMDGRLDAIFAAHAGCYLLVRPDRYIAAVFKPDDVSRIAADVYETYLVKNGAAGSAESIHMVGSSTVRPSARWPALLALGIIALMVAFYGWELIAVRKDAAALASLLRALFDRGGWLMVYSSSVGGSLGWVFRSALVQASVGVFGKVAAFWLVWSAVNTAATLIYVLSYFGFADAMNARPGPIQKINVFVRRWAIPVLLVLGLALPPIPITLVLFLVASAKMSYGRFALPYAVGSAVGIASVLYSNGTAMLDPDVSMMQLLVLLALPFVLVPLYQQLKKLAVRVRKSRSR